MCRSVPVSEDMDVTRIIRDRSALSVITFSLGVHRRLLEIDIETLEEHISDVERDFNRRRRKLEESLTRKAESLSDRDKEELGDIYSDEFHKLEQLFPTMHRRSYLLTVMGLLESYLNRLCKYAKVARKLNVDVTDLHGRGVKRAADYLRKIINVEFPESDEWKEILIAHEIRNLVAHNDGYLKDGSSNQVRAYASRTSRVTVSEKNEIALTDEYVPALLEAIRGFADQLVSAMEKALTSNA